VKLASVMERGSSARRGDTIVAVPERHVMKRLCVEESDSQALLTEAARKLFKIRFADRDGCRRSASFLVQRRYAWRGYQIDAPTNVQPNRITLSAYDGEATVATISVGLDSPSGLFVDALYAPELHGLRRSGCHVCEFTKLAIDEAVKSKPVLAAIFHIAYIYARRIHGCSDLVVEVNPRHVKFYERMLGFQTLGPVRMDPRVNAPATLLRLQLAYAEQQISKFGGKGELAAAVRSLYPLFFSPREEQGIEMRLRAFG
jgi:hypothetical protein